MIIRLLNSFLIDIANLYSDPIENMADSLRIFVDVCSTHGIAEIILSYPE